MEKLKVLVVDDDREIVDSIAIFLRADGYEIEKAYNGLEALDIVMTHTVHLIILDIMMPELDGIKTLLKLRESRNIPVILLSAKSEDADKILGLTAGADDYVTKPFNPSELVARVKSQLRRYTQLGAMEKTASQIVIRGLVLDTESKSVTVDGSYNRPAAPCTARSSAYISTAKLGFTRNNNSFKCCKRFSLEDTSNKRYSFFANNFVNAKPIPPVAPVINTVFFMARPSFPVHTYHTG